MAARPPVLITLSPAGDAPSASRVAAAPHFAHAESVSADPSSAGREPDALAPLRGAVRLLDGAIRIPGTSLRIGLDPVLGLVPGLGDALGALLSGWLVLRAARLGASRATLVRMLGNVLVDGTVGSVPLIGDLFDVAYRANARNLALLEGQLADPTRRARTDRRFVGLVVAAAVAIPLLLGALAAWLVVAAARWLV